MAFPYNDQSQLISQQGILGGVATVVGTTPALVVSTINSITTTAISANQQLSAVLLAGTSNIGYVSAFVDNGSISARSGDANQVHVSAVQGDAGLFRVSSIGASTTSNDILVDGSDNTISARIVQVSAAVSSNLNAFVVRATNFDSATQFRVSAFVDSGSISAKNQDANFMHVSGFSPDAGLFIVSSKQGDASLLRTSALNQDANFMHVSGFSPDAALFRVSGIQGDGVNLNVSAKSLDAGTLLTSAKQGDAGLFRTSGLIDNGSISAKSGDANQVHVSSVQGDAGLFRVSGFTATATNFPVSSTQGDASLLRISSLGSVVTTGTGGASLFSTSAGIAQVSTVKSSSGRLYGYHLLNPAGVDQYLQVFNVSGGATLGTDIPTLTLGVPAGTGSNVGSGAVMSLGAGIGFGTGMQIAVTSTPAGNTAGASAMRVNIFYA